MDSRVDTRALNLCVGGSGWHRFRGAGQRLIKVAGDSTRKCCLAAQHSHLAEYSFNRPLVPSLAEQANQARRRASTAMPLSTVASGFSHIAGYRILKMSSYGYCGSR